MSILSRLAVLALPLSVLAACDTSVTPTYQTTPENTIYLQQVAAAGERASVAGVTVAEGVNANPTCRLMGPLDVGGGLSVGQALTSALQAELLAGGTFAANGTPVSLTLTQLQVDSFDGFWLMAGTVTTPKLPQGYSVQTRFDYSTSFSAYAACNNSAMAFNRAAAKFINAVVSHPSFMQAI